MNKIRSDRKKKEHSSLDKDTRMFFTGKKEFTAGIPSNNDDILLIDAISRIAIHGSAAHDLKIRSD